MKCIFKKITRALSVFIISIASLCFISCGDVLNYLIPVLLGQITDFTANPGDGFVLLSWSNGYVSGYLYLETKVTSTGEVDGDNSEFLDPDAEGFLPTACFVDNLANGTSYTFTLRLYEERSTTSNVISYATTRATPSEDAGGGSGGSGGGGSGSGTTWDVSPGNYFLELPGNTSSVTITGVNGKMITYANVNTGTSGIIKSSAVRRYVSGLRAADTGIRVVDSAAVQDAGENESVIKHFVAPSSVNVKPNPVRSGASGDTWNKSNPRIGQTRSIYVDTNSDLSSFQQEQMTLYAIGYDPTSDGEDIACLVWAKASDVGTGSKTKVTLNAIKDIAFKFVQHYQFEENVFGSTYDKLLTNRGSTPMSNGPTNDWVNIVLYDIGRDGTAGTCGVVGYFWAKDYYQTGYTNSSSDPRSVTNEGKYFYVDVPFCNYNSTIRDYDPGSNTVSGTVMSTLFHEYQHMIDFNTKTITYSKDTSSCTWYNEMLSMLCEDIMGDQLGLGPADRVASGRIKNFNAYYYYSGAAQYLESNSWVSYGTAYAFGAWLVRNYGGVPLIKEMSTNNAVGIDSIVKAVKTVAGVDRSWNDLMKEYIQACGFRTAFAVKDSEHKLETFNVVPEDRYEYSIIYGAGNGNITLYIRYDNQSNLVHYDYGQNALEGTLMGINLWNDTYKNSTTYGPVILSPNSSVDVQPTGFVFRNVGQATQDSVTLRFTTSSNSNEKLYIFVQDYKASSTQDTTAEVTQ